MSILAGVQTSSASEPDPELSSEPELVVPAESEDSSATPAEASPAPAVETTTPIAPEPLVLDWPLPDDDERCSLTEGYLDAHHPGGAAAAAQDGCHMAPKMVVLHWTATATAQQTWDIFAPAVLRGRPDIAKAGAVNVAAHYLVDRDGTIWRLLPDDRIGRHTIGLNHLAIGIENVGGTQDYPLTEAQVEANATLVRNLAERHTLTHLIGHYEYRQMEGHPYFQEVDPSYRTQKIDPGEDFMQQVRARVEDLELEGAGG